MAGSNIRNFISNYQGIVADDHESAVDYIKLKIEDLLEGLHRYGFLKEYSLRLVPTQDEDPLQIKFCIVIGEFINDLQKLLLSTLSKAETEITMKSDKNLTSNLMNIVTNEDILNSLSTANINEYSDISNVTLEEDANRYINIDAGVECVGNILNETMQNGEPTCEIEAIVNGMDEIAVAGADWQLTILNNASNQGAMNSITETVTTKCLKDDKWTCEMCEKKFSCLKDLNLHLVEHNGCFECSVCGKHMVTKLSLKRHLLSHINVKFECQICKKLFRRSDYLRNHHNKAHMGVPIIKCTECEEKFANKSQLSLHTKQNHPKPGFECAHCGKSFSRQDKLRDHVLRHLNFKRFECSICHKRYYERRDLVLHLKKLCSSGMECNKTFNVKKCF